MLGSLVLIMSAPVVLVFLLLQRVLLERLSYGEIKM
jgi:ABC-type glycerol-3-phosphate transport system permease component